MLWFRAPEKVYFKKGCMPVALEELRTDYHRKKAFIVTDSFLYQNGYTKPITDKLDELGITYTVFSNVQPDPTLANAQEGAKAMAAFQPDVIIALGGGSAMDAGKIMWVMYEHPEVDFQDLAMRFVDIRKRVYTFPKMGEKAYFVAIPTSSGTGSEVTPFAVITDQETGVKYPLADYELLPNMAIVDVDNMMSQPKGLTSASGVDVLTHALEAYASVMATDYTDGIALKAMKNGFARGVFSNEAGLGSAPIAHAAADVEDPVEQGIYGVFEVFMDTIVVCTMTALVVLLGVGVGNIPYETDQGANLTIQGFQSVFGGPVPAVVVAICLTLFALSTMLTWGLYGTRCFEFLFGSKAVKVYQIFFVFFVIIGAMMELQIAWNIADTLNGLMAIPNLIALIALCPLVAKLTKEHFSRVNRLRR